MTPYRACLIDVFGTVLSVDFPRYTSGLAERAGVEVEVYCDGASALGIRAVRIDRLDGGGDVATLAELVGYF